MSTTNPSSTYSNQSIGVPMESTPSPVESPLRPSSLASDESPNAKRQRPNPSKPTSSSKAVTQLEAIELELKRFIDNEQRIQPDDPEHEEDLQPEADPKVVANMIKLIKSNITGFALRMITKKEQAFSEYEQAKKDTHPVYLKHLPAPESRFWVHCGSTPEQVLTQINEVIKNHAIRGLQVIRSTLPSTRAQVKAAAVKTIDGFITNNPEINFTNTREAVITQLDQVVEDVLKQVNVQRQNQAIAIAQKLAEPSGLTRVNKTTQPSHQPVLSTNDQFNRQPKLRYSHLSQRATNSKRYFNKVGDISLPLEITETLNLGAKFIDQAAQVTIANYRDKLETELLEFIGNLLNKPFQEGNICIDMDDIIKAQQVLQGIPQPEPQRSNNSRWNQLVKFLISKQLIVKCADKNAGLTVMPKSWYMQSAMGHLKHTQSNGIPVYSKETPNPRIIDNNLTAIGRLHSQSITRFQCNESFIVKPLFYLMPKLHKVPIGVRPIIPSHSWYTTPAAKFLHSELHKLVCRFRWIITDRLTFLKEIEDLVLHNSKVRLYTNDVQALYTSIDIQKGLKATRDIMKRHNWKHPDFLCDLLHWVLKNNYFMFNNTWFRQTNGAAMGGNVSGTFADLILTEIEYPILQSVKVSLYRRFRDDIFIVTVPANASSITLQLNRNDYGLTFTREQEGDKVNFYDITVFKGQRHQTEQRLDYKLFVKPTNVQAFPLYDTYKVNSIKHSWITGENIRILRGSTSFAAYNRSSHRYKMALLNRGYPIEVITRYWKYKFSDREIILKKTDKETYNFLSASPSNTMVESINQVKKAYQQVMKSSNTRITAQPGKTILDACNVATKRILQHQRNQHAYSKDKSQSNTTTQTTLQQQSNQTASSKDESQSQH
jgi:hypothetical protein